MVNTTSATWYFFPTIDQDLSTFNMPYPAGVAPPGGYTVSDITHAEYLPDQDIDSYGTYLAYGDIYSGLPSQFAAAVCFAKCSLIRTIEGQRPIETLAVGDLVWTADQGPQPILWIGASTLSERVLRECERLRPIRIRAGALGAFTPETDLIVSPQHRIYIKSMPSAHSTQSDEVLIPAKDSVEIDGIDRVDDGQLVTYYHIMFEDHQIIMANGCLSESFFTGPEALRALSSAARQELYDIFPELMLMSGTLHHPARPFLTGKTARTLISKHLNSHSLVPSPITLS